MHPFTRFRIPTLLGLAIIILGISAGVFLVSNQQTLTSFAGPDSAPQNITFSNTEEDTITISWKTTAETAGFITYGINFPDEKTALDDRDTSAPTPRQTHYITLSNLTPQTEYKFKILAGKQSSDTLTFKTASMAVNNNDFKPVIGSVMFDNQPLNEGIIYLSIAGAITQSSVVKEFGNFIIPVGNMRTDNLERVFTPEDQAMAKLTVVSPDSQGTAIFKISQDGETVGVLKVGENLDLTIQESSSSPTPLPKEAAVFDLNGDGRVNASDHAIVLTNFGKSPKEKRADFNNDGVVDQKDLSLISAEIDKRKSSSTDKPAN